VYRSVTLVVGDMMYVVTPFPNILYGIDLKDPSSPAPHGPLTRSDRR
jgi:hypothetical protein